MARRETAVQRGSQRARAARTLLEHLIQVERGETYEEFLAYTEEFARRNRLPGTLSMRHLLRLAAGRNTDGSPLGPLRPATANLLERIFGVPVNELLGSPRSDEPDQGAVELRQRLYAARHVDLAMIDLLREQLDALRRLDRQMGAIVAYGEVREKVEQVQHLHSYSLTPGIRAVLAGVLSELGALAGWEALDRYQVAQAWKHHELAKGAAREADGPGLLAHATAQQALVLFELGEVAHALAQLAEARDLAKRTAPALLRAWLAAAYGEGLAAAGCRDEALRAFDAAAALLPADPIEPRLPFIFLSEVHLDRWRGHALARLGDAEAVQILTGALERLDPTFARAETSLRVDLAIALTAIDDYDEARVHANQVERLAVEIGSVRLLHRMNSGLNAPTNR